MMTPIPPLNKALLAAGGAALLAVGSFGAGWKVRGWKANSDELVKVAQADAQRVAAQTIANDRGAQLEVIRGQLDERLTSSNTTIKEIYRDVPAPPAVCAAPAAARRLLIDAGATGPIPPATQPNSPVPATAGPTRPAN